MDTSMGRRRVNPLPAFQLGSSDPQPLRSPRGADAPSIYGAFAQSTTLAHSAARSLLGATNEGDGAGGGSSAAGGTGGSSRSQRVAWRCVMCGYVSLAMDQHGRPLPLETDAFGRPLPMHCARCDAAHVDWEVCTPFNEFGDHANIPSAFTSVVRGGRGSYNGERLPAAPAPAAARGDGEAAGISALLQLRRPAHGAPPESRAAYLKRVLRGDTGVPPTPRAAAASAQTPRAEGRLTDLAKAHFSVHDDANGDEAEAATEGYAAFRGVSLPERRNPVLEALDALAPGGGGRPDGVEKHPVQPRPETYSCGRCGRRLFRCDQYGNVVPLDVDPQGNITPLFCAGCREAHSEWSLQPLAAARPTAAVRAPRPPAERTSRTASPCSDGDSRPLSLPDTPRTADL